MNLTPGGYEYAVHVVNLPCTVLAAVTSTDSDLYHVFINDCLSPELRRRALEHELRHIDDEHLQNDTRTISEMETEACTPVPPPALKEIPLLRISD